MTCKVIFISLCNAPLVQYEQTIFFNTAAVLAHRITPYIVFTRNKMTGWMDPNKWAHRGVQRSKVVRIEMDVKQESALSGRGSWQCWSERQKARTSPKHRRARLNLRPQIAKPSQPPPESQFITHSNSNNNTDGFGPARQHRAVNLNKNTTSKQKQRLPSEIHAVHHVTPQTA